MDARELMECILRGLGGDFHRRYAASFVDNEIFIDNVIKLNTADWVWTELGVKKLGHQLKIKEACKDALPSATDIDDWKLPAAHPKQLSARTLSPDSMNSETHTGVLSSPNHVLPNVSYAARGGGWISYVMPMDMCLKASNVTEDQFAFLTNNLSEAIV
jgi:hypothetical protein